MIIICLFLHLFSLFLKLYDVMIIDSRRDYQQTFKYDIDIVVIVEKERY